MDIFYILIGFVLLVIGGEFLVRSSVAMSLKFSISKAVIGLTIVSFATSAPELIVSLNAAIKGSSDIATGNVIGSNIANIGLVLGLTALITPMYIDKQFLKIHWPVMMLFSVVFYYFLYSNSEISLVEGIILLFLLFVYLFFLIRKQRGSNNKSVAEVEEKLHQTSYFKIVIWLLIGGAGLKFGADFLVDGAIGLAEYYEVSERIIAVSIIAIGTSVPELAASLIAALKNEKAMSVGNLIGSNIFNIALVIGITAMVKPIQLQSQEVLTVDMVWMIGISALLLPLALIKPKYQLKRYKGLLIFISYLVFMYVLFLRK